MSHSGAGRQDGRNTTEPVNLSNGNLFLPATDVQIPGRGLGLTFTRTYNSQVITHFPHNWSTGLGSWVVENGEASGEGGQNWHPRTWGDFELTTRMRTLAQDPEGAFPDREFHVGWLHFRFKDYENHYQLLLKTTGVLELVKYYRKDGAVQRRFWRAQTALSPFQWHTFHIRMQGNRILIRVNGALLLTADDPYPLPAGRIGLEAHRSHVHWDDFTLTDLSAGGSHTHTFDDIPNQEGMFGYGWTSNLEMRLEEDHHAGGMMRLIREDGWEEHFETNPDGTYASPPGVKDRLTRTVTGYSLRRNDGLQWAFDAQGRLISVTDRNGNSLSISRDAGGRVTRLTDPAGRSLTFTYGPNGKVAAVVDPAGRRWTYAYDSARHLTLVTHPLGVSERYEYDPLTHNLIRFIDPTGAVFQYAYTIDDRVKTQIDPVGKVTTFSWEVPFAGLGGTATTRVRNALGETWNFRFKLEDEARPHVHDQIHVITDPYGNTEGFAWNADKNRIGKTDESGRSIFWEHDTQGNPTKIIQFVPPAGSGLSSVSILRYEPVFGQITALYDPNEHETHFEYDPKGNLTKLWRPFNYVDRVENGFAYDSYGQVLSAADPLGRTWRFSYDAHGNRTSATDPLGNVTTAAYDVLGRPVSVTDAEGRTTQLAWDLGGRLVKVTDPLGGETRYSYDGNGRTLSVTDPMGRRTTFTYDRVGNLTRVADPLGNKTLYAWDTADFMHRGTSRLLRMTDPRGKVTRYAYDARGRLIQVTDPLGNVTRYGYDATTHVTSITDANGGITRFEYDPLERLVSSTDPLGNVTRFGYDRLGHLTSRTDADGRRTVYTYDALDQLARIAYPDSSTVSFAYDKAGNRTQMTDSTGVTSYQYDALDRPVRVTRPVTATPVTYSYDRIGNRTSMTSEVGRTGYAYDALNRLIRLTDPYGGTYDFRYDRASRRTQLRYPNGLSANYSYDIAGRLTRIQTLDASLSTLLDLVYTYDWAGNVVFAIRGPAGTSGAGRTMHLHDALNQLIWVSHPSGVVESFSYDKVGNRQAANDVSYSYDAANRLLAAGNTAYAYDRSGNRISQQNPSAGSLSYSYDGAYRLTSIQSASLTQTALYDGDGSRVARTINGATTRYLQDGLDSLAELAAANSRISTSYVHGPGIDELLAVRDHSTGRMLYVLSDRLGSTAALADESGRLQASFAYSPFGDTRIRTGSADTRFRFTGRELDAESGLYHYRARAYDPTVGRFLQPDPLPRTPADPRMMGLGYFGRLVTANHPLPGAVPGFLPAALSQAAHANQTALLRNPLGLNSYPYVLNNPLLFTDPLGLEGRESGIPILDAVSEFLSKNHVNIGIAGGIGKYGAVGGIKFNASGIYYYYGAGLGVGISATLTVNGGPVQTGTSVVGQRSGGYGGLGGRVSGNVTESGLSISWGLGLGVGNSQTVTATKTGTVISFDSD